MKNLNKRLLNEFTIQNIAGKSDYIEFSNLSSGAIDLKPGRYAIVPFTHDAINKSCHIIVNFHYLDGQIEVEGAENNDNNQRHASLMGGTGNGKTDDEEININKLMSQNEKFITNVEKEINEQLKVEAKKKLEYDSLITPPMLIKYEDWEYGQDIDEISILTMYQEIGSIAKYVTQMKSDVNNMKNAMNELQNNSSLLKNHNNVNVTEDDNASNASSLTNNKRNGSNKRPAKVPLKNRMGVLMASKR